LGWEATAPKEYAIDVDRELPPAIGLPLLELGLPHLDRLGAVSVARYMVQTPAGPCEADRVRYPDGLWLFEVEVDTDDEVRHRATVEWLHRHADCAVSLVSKYSRFLLHA
jgi:hypothetical protein